MSNHQRLAGQQALVTGANSGIGKGVAVALGRAGASVVVNYVYGDDAANAVVDEIRRGGSNAILGAMLESNLEGGNQPLTDRSALKYGVSITDPCIDWATTERCLLDAASALATPR